MGHPFRSWLAQGDGKTISVTNIIEDNNPPPKPEPRSDSESSDTTPRIYDYTVVDGESGIDHYEYKVDYSEWVDIGLDGEFTTSVLSDGNHIVHVKAVDKAGNSNIGFTNVYVRRCECSSGPCCSDNCYYDAAGTICDTGVNPVYRCEDGHGLGSDIYIKTQYRECSGNSAECSGNWKNEPYKVYRDCGSTEYCANDGDKSCTSCSTVCDESCQSASCYGIDPDCTESGGSTKCSDAGGSCSGGKCDIDCDSGPCCKDGKLLPGNYAYWVCEWSDDYEYKCINGHMAGNDVYRARYRRLCDGLSKYCNGPWGLGSWNKYDDCNDNQRCAHGGDTYCSSVPSEVCDGLDNDYDGKVDEGLVGDACSLQQGVCANAYEKCVDASYRSCSAADYGFFYETVEVSCDNLDNDCDGSIDEIKMQCGTIDVGECEYGTISCVDGQWQDCIGAVYSSLELCDGLDNDCNGRTDEDLVDTPLCENQQGVCEGSTKRCGGLDEWLDCSSNDYGEYYEEIEVTKDSLDNDCDGSIDENNAPVVQEINNVEVIKGDVVLINVDAIDYDNDELIYYINDFRFMQDGNLFWWNTTYDDIGVYSVMITVSDGLVDDNQEVVISVLDFPDLVIDDEVVNLYGTHYFKDVFIINNGILNISGYNGTDETGILKIFADNIFVDSSSKVDGDGKGFRGGDNNHGEGPGGGTGCVGCSSNYGAAGGGYGGRGGGNWVHLGGGTYGSLDGLSIERGSGGGSNYYKAGNGGAAISFFADQIIVGGIITSNGGKADKLLDWWDGGDGGGSGGGILMHADKVNISGLLSANGSDATKNQGSIGCGAGGGGGGRIKVFYKELVDNGVLSAAGGLGSWDEGFCKGQDGKDGTVAFVSLYKKGDINDDDNVDILDLILARNFIGLILGDNGWDDDVDVNEDGAVDLLDFIEIRNNFINE